MLSKLQAIFAHKDLRNRILFTLLMLVLYRLIVHIPIPGVDTSKLQEFFSSNEILGLVDIFSGGSVAKFSVALLGVIPFINASIIMQIMTMALPSLEALSKEGEFGRRKINQYTRYLTVPFALMQSYGTILFLQKSNLGILESLSLPQIVAIMITATAGTVFLMWLGELITEKGIGNGVSLIIFAGIVASLPGQLASALALSSANGYTTLIVLGLIALATTFFIVYVNEAHRNIPISYGGRGTANRLFGGVSTHLPLKLNQAGVIPIIFAVSLILFPGLIAQLFVGARSEALAKAAIFIRDLFQDQTFYAILYFILVVGFTYFYTWVVFNPERVAENIQKQGGFVAGIRPGTQTVKYLSMLINRLTLFGGLFLAILAIMPIVIQGVLNVGALTVGGISMLIVVSVALDTMRQIDAQLVMRRYENA